MAKLKLGQKLLACQSSSSAQEYQLLEQLCLLSCHPRHARWQNCKNISLRLLWCSTTSHPHLHITAWCPRGSGWWSGQYWHAKIFNSKPPLQCNLELIRLKVFVKFVKTHWMNDCQPGCSMAGEHRIQTINVHGWQARRGRLTEILVVFVMY